MTTTCLIGVAVGNVSSGPAACAAPVVIKAATAVPSNSLRSDMTFPELLTERRASYGRRRRLSYEGIMTVGALSLRAKRSNLEQDCFASLAMTDPGHLDYAALNGTRVPPGCVTPPRNAPGSALPHKVSNPRGNRRLFGIDSHRRNSSRSWWLSLSSSYAVRPWKMTWLLSNWTSPGTKGA